MVGVAKVSVPPAGSDGMNGVHDMGGMHGMGPIQHEKNEPVFHARWEARVFALNRAHGSLAASGTSTRRGTQIELIPPAEYLRMSYYEKWLVGLDANCSSRAAWSRARRSRAASRRRGSPKATSRADRATRCRCSSRRAVPRSRDAPVAPQFQVGQRVRARNINPAGHTRLPRYARGKARHRSSAIMACSSSPTPTPISSARSRSTSTRCASPRASCGASRPRRAIPFTSTCGTTTLSRPDSIANPDVSPRCRACRATTAGRCLPSRGRRKRSRSRSSSREQGHFTWKEWAAALADELKAAADRGEPDDGSDYYEHWLAALERLVTAKGLGRSGRARRAQGGVGRRLPEYSARATGRAAPG